MFYIISDNVSFYLFIYNSYIIENNNIPVIEYHYIINYIIRYINIRELLKYGYKPYIIVHKTFKFVI